MSILSVQRQRLRHNSKSPLTLDDGSYYHHMEGIAIMGRFKINTGHFDNPLDQVFTTISFNGVSRGG